MPKLIVSMDGVVLNELDLNNQIIRIGRNPKNEVRIDNRAISAEHAVIKQNAKGDYVIEDLDSTNGTTLNGKKVNANVLKHNDVIALGKYHLKFIKDDQFDQQRLTSEGLKFEKTDVAELIAQKEQSSNYSSESGVSIYKTISGKKNFTESALDASSLPFSSEAFSLEASSFGGKSKHAKMRFVQNNALGKAIPIEKEMVRIGRNNDVARIVRQNCDYFLYYEQGEPPKINGVIIDFLTPHLLKHQERIEIGGMLIEFLYD